jgi:outer membrane protein W
MRALSALIAAATLCSMAAPSLAQDASSQKASTKGFYATAGAGGSWGSSASTTYNNPSVTVGGVTSVVNGTLNGNTPLGGGVAVEAGAGYDFGNSIRAELTYIYNNASIGATALGVDVNTAGVKTTGTINANTSGTLNSNSVFVSGYYDIKNSSKFTPYAGAGIGYTSISLPNQNASGTFNLQFAGLGSASGSGTVNQNGGSASAFGYQAKIGVSYALSKPADVFVEGTYQGNTGVSINNLNLSALNLFGVRAGFRYRFGS